MVRIGLDIGSTTVKAVAVDTNEKVIYESYRRHMSRITEMSAEMLSEIKRPVVHIGCGYCQKSELLPVR